MSDLMNEVAGPSNKANFFFRFGVIFYILVGITPLVFRIGYWITVITDQILNWPHMSVFNI